MWRTFLVINWIGTPVSIQYSTCTNVPWYFFFKLGNIKVYSYNLQVTTCSQIYNANFHYWRSLDHNRLFHLRKTCSIVRLIVSNTVITKNKGKQIANSNLIIFSILHVLLSYCIVGNLKSKKYELVLCLIIDGPLTTNL